MTACQGDPALPVLHNDLQENATPTYSSPLVNRWWARRRETLQLDETWVGGGTVNCRTCAIGKGKKTSIRSKSNSQRMFDVVIGQGLLRGGWIKRDSRSWVSSALWSGAGFSVTTDRIIGRGGGGYLRYSRLARFVFPFLHHTPYFLCSGRLMTVICDRTQWPRVPTATDNGTRLHHLDSEQGVLVNLGTRMTALCRSVHWGRNWLSIVRQS